MTSISFTLPDKYLNKKSQLQGMINAFKGDFNSTQTKDGTAYFVDFENDSNVEEFNQKLNELIPEIHNY